MIEKIFFNVIAIALFTITFLKLIKKNDTTYIHLLIIQFIGLAINFIELIMQTSFHWMFKIIMYILSVIIPLAILWFERVMKADFAELFRITQANIMQKLGKPDKAKDILNQFLNKNMQSAKAHKFLAELYEKDESYEAAINEYRKAVELKPKDFDAGYKLCYNLNKNKQNEEAISTLKDILKLKPEFENATNLLADIYFEQSKYQEAISVYMDSLRYHPGSYDLYYGVAMAYTMMNNFQRAKEFYEKAAEINSMAYNARLNLGQIALMQGDLDEAEAYFRKSMEQEDLEAGSYYYLSQIALLKGDEEKAKNYMNVAIQLDGKVYKQMQKDPLFIPIKNEVLPPKQQIEEENEQKRKLQNKKEKTVTNYLMKVGMLMESLSNEDIKAMMNKREKQKENIR